MQEMKVTQQEGVITYDFKALKRYLEDEMALYTSQDFSLMDISEAKSKRADFNKLVAKIEDERKRIKKLYQAPLVAFENEVKELVGIITNVNLKIDTAVKSKEEAMRVEKIGLVNEVYNKLDDSLKVVPLSRVMRDEWLNKSFSINKVKEELSETLQTIVTQIKIINESNREYKDVMLGYYLGSLNINKAEEDFTSFLDNVKRVEKKIEVQEPPKEEVEEQMYEISLTITSSRAKIKALQTFLLESGIKYHKI